MRVEDGFGYVDEGSVNSVYLSRMMKVGDNDILINKIMFSFVTTYYGPISKSLRVNLRRNNRPSIHCLSRITSPTVASDSGANGEGVNNHSQ